MGRILAIDFGKKRTGIAVTDPLQIIATGLETVDSKELIGYLKKYFASEEVDKVLIGYPLKMATEAMLQMGLKKKDRANKGLIDEISATIILQEYLQSKI